MLVFLLTMPCHKGKRRRLAQTAKCTFVRPCNEIIASAFSSGRRGEERKLLLFPRRGLGGLDKKKLDSFSFHLAKKNFMRTFPSALDLINFFVEGMT